MEKSRKRNRRKSNFRRLIRKRLELIMAGIGVYSVRQRRKFLSDCFMEKFNGEVRYGHFTGLKIFEDSSWSQSYRSSILFGIYEKEVLNSLSSIPSNYTHLIDLGAADGYYGVGAVASGMFSMASCYESTNDGQKIIYKTAVINGVESSVRIFGEAKHDFYKDFSQNVRDKSVLLLDVEGSEFEILSAEVFIAFKNSIIISEIHPSIVENGNERMRKLREKSMKTHSISEINTGSRDLSIFSELSNISDNDRWLICSEGRSRLGIWWRFDPLLETT